MGWRIMAALPYIQLYIAEYLADTAHLTTLQHGAYLLLIFNYWQRGKALSNSSGRLASVARMSKEDWLLIEPTIAEFFEVTDNEWVHHRIECDLVDVLAKSTKASAAGKASAQKRYGARDDLFNERSTNVQPLRTDTDAEQKYLNSYPSMPDGISDVDRREETRLAKEAAKEAEKRAKADAREVARAAKAIADAAAKAAVKKYREEQRLAKKKSSPPTNTEMRESRHADFKIAIFEYWKSKNPEIDCPWQQAEGMQLELWLRGSPTTTLFQFKNMLRNRYRSDVTHSERPSVWIKNITNYASGPLDRFGKPMATGGKANGKSADRAFNTAADLIQEIEDNHGAHTGQLLQGSGAY
ncbi:unnamed protein product [Sphagnum jensenii]